MRKFTAFLCTFAFVAATAGATLAGPGCSGQYEQSKKEEPVSS